MKRFLLCTAIALMAAMPALRLNAHDHTDGWMPLPVSGDTIGKGSTDEQPARYYLTADTRLEKDLVITDSAVVTLCLNGYQLTGTGQNPVIRVSSARLTVCDCQEGSDAPEHQHPYYQNADGLFVFDDGTDEWDSQHEAADTTGVIAGGVITGGWGDWNIDIYSNYGGGINVLRGHLTLESGAIAGNRATSGNKTDFTGGAGISVFEGEVVVNGGQVAGNTSTAQGGGIYAAGYLTLNGGKIWGNKAYQGGGIFTSSQAGVVVMNGGEVSGNTTDWDGGGVKAYIQSQFTLNGGLITGNTGRGSGGGIRISQAKTCTINGGTVADNIGAFGCDLSVSCYGGNAITITGGIIAGNTASSDTWLGKNIYINGLHDADAECSVTGGYMGLIGIEQRDSVIEGGFFTGSLPSNYLAEGCISIPAGDGVEGYREGFPHAVYKRDTTATGIAPAITPGSPVYDQAPIEPGADFTVAGIPDSLYAVYAHRTDTTAPPAYGLPTDAGTHHVTVTLLHADGRWHYGQMPFDITIAKAEWTGEKSIGGTVTAGQSDSITLPALPEGAYCGTPTGDPRILNPYIADGQLHYTGSGDIEPGEVYTLVIPVGEGVNYHIFAILVQLTGNGTSGLPSTDGPVLRVTGTHGQLHIAGTTAPVAIYDLHGHRVYQGLARTIDLPAGLYLVHVDGEVRKAVVR